MTSKQKEQLVEIIKNNAKWPLIIEGVKGISFSQVVTLPATTPSSELGVLPTENGFQYPAWFEEVFEKAKNGKSVLLVIENMDNISAVEQEKFYGILKYKGVNGVNFPASTQIIIPVLNSSLINVKIASLAIIHKV